MKRLLIPICIFFVIVLPSMMVSISNDLSSTTPTAAIVLYPSADNAQTIRVKEESEITEMELDEYLVCVLLGEMPADFEVEALKAQAVAARTYTLRKIHGKSKHEDADVCTNAACCQAFVTRESYLSVGGTAEDLKKMSDAVRSTASEVITFEGNLIEATYFSCSGGVTEDAVAVWGTDLPYLKSVTSPGEEEVKYFESRFRYSKNEFLSLLGLPETLTLTDNSFLMTYTQGNGVASLYIGNAEFTGIQIRSLLELPSTAFQLSLDGQDVIVDVKGYGHRVGMSQYGAEAMAVSGKRYDEILLHYYPGTKLESLTSEQMKAVFDKAGNL